MFYNIRISATNGPGECFKYISEALQTVVAPLASAMKKASGSSSSIFDIYLFKQTAPRGDLTLSLNIFLPFQNPTL